MHGSFKRSDTVSSEVSSVKPEETPISGEPQQKKVILPSADDFLASLMNKPA